MPQRIKGTLESFERRPVKSHAFVRIGKELLHLPTANRGVLQPGGTIALCANGDRYNPIPLGTTIEIDVEYDREGKDPFPVAWAPR